MCLSEGPAIHLIKLRCWYALHHVKVHGLM